MVSFGSSYAFVKLAFDETVAKASERTFEAVSSIARAGIMRFSPSFAFRLAKKVRKAVKRIIRESVSGPTVPERLAAVRTEAFTDQK